MPSDGLTDMPVDAPVLITGLSGFIARQTALDLLRQGRQVRGTLRRMALADGLRAQLQAHGANVARLELVHADLLADAGWDHAMAGCRAVLHTASPHPLTQPPDRLALVPEARDGTLRVLQAARAAGVRRVVVTSSLVAVMAGQPVPPGRVFTESDWSHTEAPLISPYAISKTLAERAAWDAVRDAGPELVAINPGFVLGPMLDGYGGTSAEVIRMLLTGRYPAVPQIHLPTVDVRDVSAAHLAALDAPAAAGRRLLLAERTLTLMQMVRLLAEALPERRSRLPLLTVPDWTARVLAMVDTHAAAVLPELGKHYQVDNRAAPELLGITLRDAGEAVVASARSLIDHQRA